MVNLLLSIGAALGVGLTDAKQDVNPSDAAVVALAQKFAGESQELGFVELQRGYKENFKTIPPLSVLDRQAKALESYRGALRAIPKVGLSNGGSLLSSHLAFELDTRRQRVVLERRFRESSTETGPDLTSTGLHALPDGQAWYQLYLTVNASSPMTPADVQRLGTAEVARVKRKIARIQKKLGFAGDDAGFYGHLNKDAQFLTEPEKIQKRFETIRKRSRRRLSKVADPTAIPVLAVRAVEKPDKNTPPGYYSDNTFRYNPYGDRYGKRVMDWLFIHEGIPGHHYQVNTPVRPSLAPRFSALFWYPGFTEGWAAYAENVGLEAGFYADVYAELGKWEWDLVRSTRLVIDVGIHHRGWSRDEALQFWKENVPNQDSIAEREVDRITRWPGQVLSYKAGEIKIREIRRAEQSRLGRKFDLRDFHKRVLEHGPIPLVVLEQAFQQ